MNLAQGGYDLGIHIGDLKESNLKARKLCDCARIVCCSPEYAKNWGLPKSVAELAQHSEIAAGAAAGFKDTCPASQRLHQ